jgi:membrane-associated phospholipid phosphatase
VIFVVATLVVPCRASADGVERAGDVLQIVLPVTAYGMTVAFDDFEGTRQLTRSLLATMTATVVLKYAVDAQRPDGGGQSFPSGHTAAAFAGASFIQQRYGWRLGIPAYGAAAFVAWSRVDAGRHHVEDVLAGAGLAMLSAYLLTTPLPDGIIISPGVADGTFGVVLSGVW